MKRYITLVATLWVALLPSFCGNALAQSDELDMVEANSLAFSLKFAELKQQVYEAFGRSVERQVFTEFSAEEQVLFENLEYLVDFYGLEVSDETNGLHIADDYYWPGCSVVLAEYSELGFMCVFGFMAAMDWDSMEPVPAAAAMSAYLEELGIRELKQALANTDEQLLVDAFTVALNTAYRHLLSFAALLHEDPFDYKAQILDQADVDLVLTEASVLISEGFQISAGVNDAWYEPATDGQGFFITVYPEKGTVFVGWFTFDMDFPNQEVIAGLGDACQRWLTAQGPYDGNKADLVVYNSSGGLFDSVLAAPKLEPIGTITLQFENCETGTVSYDLSSYGVMGEIPIQRLASDHIAACRVQSYLNR